MSRKGLKASPHTPSKNDTHLIRFAHSVLIQCFLFASRYYESLYDRCCKWTEKIDIFQYEFLVVPLFKDEHWSVAFVCYPGLLLKDAIDVNRNQR